MSVLDTFFLLFEGDATGAKKASEETEKASEKTAQSVVKHDEQIKQAHHQVEEENSRLAESFEKVKEHAHESFMHIIEQVAELTLAYQGLISVEKLVENAFEQAEKSDQLGETARQIGVNIEQLDAWGQAVRRVGGTAEGFEGSLKAVEFRMQRIALAAAEGKTGGDRSSRFFKALGISPEDTKDIFKLLEEIPQKIEGMDKGKSNALLRGIGLDDGTIRLLQSGSKEVEELIEKQKRLGSITAEDAETAERFNREWMDVKELFRNITVSADTEFLPVLQSLLEAVESFVEFLRDHKDLAIGFFIGLAGAVIYLGEVAGVVGAILDVVFAPLTLWTAGIIAMGAAVALVYDDIVNFGEGNKSVIGELAKRWPIIGDIFRGLIEIVHAFWKGVKIGTEVIVNDFAIAFNAISKIVKVAVDAMIEAFTFLWSKIGWIFEKLESAPRAIAAAVGIVSDKPAAGKDGKPVNPWEAHYEKDAKGNLHRVYPTLEKEKKSDEKPSLIPETKFPLVKATLAPTHEDRPLPDHPMVGAPEDIDAIVAARAALSNAQGSSLMAQTPQSLATAGATNNEKNVNINSPVTINITANGADPAAIRNELDNHLEEHYKSVLSTFADGVTH